MLTNSSLRHPKSSWTTLSTVGLRKNPPIFSRRKYVLSCFLSPVPVDGDTGKKRSNYLQVQFQRGAPAAVSVCVCNNGAVRERIRHQYQMATRQPQCCLIHGRGGKRNKKRVTRRAKRIIARSWGKDYVDAKLQCVGWSIHFKCRVYFSLHIISYPIPDPILDEDETSPR